MRESLLDILRCPGCGAERRLGLEAAESDAREVRAGALACAGCGMSFGVERGVVDLLHDPPEHIAREAAGLGRFAAEMRADGWDRERILNLPYEQSGYWYAQAVSMQQVLDTVDLRPGERILDLGSNTCWASATFAERGLDVVALDIATAEMQGLHTSEWWFDGRGVYFERVLGSMFDIPLASGSLDHVFACEVLHHNDPQELSRTFREIHRVLKPGGRLIVVNEQMKFPLELKRDHGQEVAEFEGHEHVYFFHRYWLGARRAGFRRIEILEPPYHHFFRGDVYALAPDDPLVKSLKVALLQVARKTRAGRRAYLAYRTLLGGGISLNMICEKG